MSNDELKLGYFSPMDGWSAIPYSTLLHPPSGTHMCLACTCPKCPGCAQPFISISCAAIHITDLDPHSMSAGGGLEDVSLVEKYEISEDDYIKRDKNFRRSCGCLFYRTSSGKV